MTLDDCYQQNQGKALLIPGGGAGNEGQCVQWADTVLHDVYGFPYHWGNAIDWWRNPSELLDHFDQITDGSIKKGDIVIFNEKTGSVYGHIDVAAQDGTTQDFQGYDSNWGGNKTVHTVHHIGSQYVVGSLRLKGEDMSLQADLDLANYKLGLEIKANETTHAALDLANYKLSESDKALRVREQQATDLINEITALKAMNGTADGEANVLGKALLKLLATLGYKKG